MDLFYQKAKVLALDAAKKSQELANQAAKMSQELATMTATRSKELAKMSQELATETAKRSKELAVDVSKKADQLKAYAGELTPAIASKAAAVSGAAKPTEEELLEYGITPELREFVQGLTIKTFRDFPLESTEAAKQSEAGVKPDQITRQDLTEWQERHAVLVLLAVQEMSDFRYVLCPRRMKESRFWKIYFTLVNSYIAPYEARAKEKAGALVKESAERARLAEEKKSAGEQATRDLKASPTTTSEADKDTSAALKLKNPDNDLDAFLMGVDSEDDGDDDDGFDADFDKLVNSTADSDDDSSPTDDESKKSKQSSRPSTTKVAVSEGSSDGELVEIPDTESDQAAQKSK